MGPSRIDPLGGAGRLGGADLLGALAALALVAGIGMLGIAIGAWWQERKQER